MTSARFSTFELLLLQSRDQADTAALLLLAWVLTHRGPVGEAERAHLVALTGAFRHGHDLAPILEIAANQDLSAIQLAAEVLQKELHGESARAFLRLAIALASDTGEPTLANHHVLRFLADLLGVAPEEFATLYASQAGRPLAAPADPSRRDYWRAREGRSQEERHEASAGRQRADQARDEAAEAAERRRAEQAEARRQAREAREEAKRQREAQRQEEKARRRAEREAARQHRQARREAEKRRRQAEREAARRDRQKAEERRRQRHRAERERQSQRQEERRQGEQHKERHSRREDTGRHAGPPPDARVRGALAVLGLEPGASRGEIRKAYRRLAQAHHPDRFYHEGEAIVASASRRFQRIRRAYDFLMKVS
ncbi:DnaJ domain-containing protein [Halomonas beimenensis]|uniref:J domain-containing protein n=1 Tax=Halomonas beimenensis TaxID=475662 RepID=A0A291P9P0_9GAMM|nr:J domain-containing protein [Halomonas beimenensis]ATJ83610.1 hypothetical protein BEI_2623 [Halomonas beimenensis]